MARKTNAKRNRFGAEVITNIDKEALKAYLKKINRPTSYLSKEMGYDPSYLSGFFRDKFLGMPKTSYKLMCMILKVDEDKFLIKESAPVSEFVDTHIKVQESNKDVVAALNQIAQAMCAQTLMIAKLYEELKKFNEPQKKSEIKDVSATPEVVISKPAPPAFVKKI